MHAPLGLLISLPAWADQPGSQKSSASDGQISDEIKSVLAGFEKQREPDTKRRRETIAALKLGKPVTTANEAEAVRRYEEFYADNSACGSSNPHHETALKRSGRGPTHRMPRPKGRPGQKSDVSSLRAAHRLHRFLYHNTITTQYMTLLSLDESPYTPASIRKRNSDGRLWEFTLVRFGSSAFSTTTWL